MKSNINKLLLLLAQCSMSWVKTPQPLELSLIALAGTKQPGQWPCHLSESLVLFPSVLKQGVTETVYGLHIIAIM